MAKHGKKFSAVAATVDRVKLYELEEALAFLKANKVAKFDETAEIAFRRAGGTLPRDFAIIHYALQMYPSEVLGDDALWARIKPALPGLSRIVVWETAHAGCEYRGD